MKNVAIINHFGKKKVDYIKALKGIDAKYEFFTNKGYVEQFENDFSVIHSYEDYKEDENIYYDLIRMHREDKFDAIIATSEFDIEKVAEIRDFLQIPGQTYKSGMIFRNKLNMKNSLKGIVNLPEFSEVNSIVDVIKFIDENGLPVVIKPQADAGSKGLNLIFSDKDLRNFFRKGLTPGLMIEKYIKGDMYHVDGLYKDGQLMLSIPSMYVNGCLAFEDDEFLGSLVIQKDNPLRERLNNEVKKVIDHLPTPKHTIAFHAEFFVDSDQNITFCEIGSRVGGAMVVESIKYITGINILEKSVRAELSDISIDLSAMESSNLSAWILIPPKEGILKDISISTESWIEDVLFKEEFIGKNFNGASTSVDFVISYLISGKTEGELIERMNSLYKWQCENMIWETKQITGKS
ncbi:ATP-grasp domain-containing protein [Lysinibacillus sp. NPDC093190]|uniref:ATP-grasp domain-containing protein n=1 Tax=Lysinibacillus sp. NPDC093190 TaxID=3390575 RepID=UPI003D0541FF